MYRSTSSDIRASRRRSSLYIVAFGLLAGVVLAAAWPTELSAQSQPSEQVAAQDAPQLVTADEIEALRKQAAEATDLDDGTKQRIDAFCGQALDGLQRIARFKKNEQKYKEDAEQVEQRVAQLKQDIAEVRERQPSPPQGLNLTQLEQEIARREVELASLKAAQAEAEAEPSRRASRRREIRTFLVAAAQQAAEIQAELEKTGPADEAALLTQARRIDLLVRRQLLDAQLPALQNELAKYDAEDAADYVRLLRDYHNEKVRLAQQELELLQAMLSRERAADMSAAVTRAREKVAETPEPLRPFAKENVEFAEAAHVLGEPIEEAERKLESAKERLEEVQKQFTASKQRVNEIGLTGSVGALLRKKRGDLPNLRRLERNVEQRKNTIENVQYALFEYDELRSESLASTKRRMLAAVAPADQAELEQLEAAVTSLIESRREYLDSVIRNYNSQLDTLFELDATEQRLIRETERFASYIDERVLWIRSNRMLFAMFEVDASDLWSFDPDRWLHVGRLLAVDFREHPVIYVFSVFAFGVLLWRKRRLRRELDRIGETAARSTCATFVPTMRAAIITVVLAATWPAFVRFLAWRLNTISNGAQFARGLAQGMFAVSWLYFPLELLRRTCRPGGLAEAHFDWPKSSIAVLRTQLRWGALLGLPVVFVTSLLAGSDSEHGSDLIERLCLIFGMLILMVFIRRIVHPKTGAFREYLAQHRGGWMGQLTPIWYWGCVLAPLMLAGMALAGYYYTAQQLTWRFYATFVFAFAVQLLRSFLRRLLLVKRRSISIEQARQRLAAEAANREQAVEGATPGGPEKIAEKIVPVDELKLNVAANTEQTQRLISTGVVVVSLVGLWLIWVDVLPALRILDRWPVWTTTVTTSTDSLLSGDNGLLSTSSDGDAKGPPRETIEQVRAVTVADIGLAMFLGIVTLICARNIPGLMEIFVLQRLPVDNSIRYAVTSVTSYVIVLLGVILAFNAIAVGWSKVQWLATALTFGLAFGLQEIFANFVAGLILLFERPLRVGDIVTMDDVTGVVSRIRIRATTITDWDRKEYVIPNKEFITGRMLNWTLTDKTNRIVIEVGVAYGSDVGLAKELLLKVCQDHPLVLDDPPTLVTFEGFGDNSLNLVVRTFLPDLEKRLVVIDELHTAIDSVFRQEKIEIAFPQRDLHLRSIDPLLLNGAMREQDPNWSKCG